MAGITQPDWVGGTITLTAGETGFTVDGVDLTLINVAAGDQIYHTATGRWLIVGDVTGTTTGDLAYPCPADLAGANLPLRIRYQPDVTRMLAALQKIQALRAGGNLDALAGLTGVPKSLSYFTGAGTMGLIDFPDFGRGLAATPDAATLWQSLGVAPVANVPATLTPDKAFRRGNVLGSVTQSGGVPTAALIERGSNAAGDYARFADGTQICVGHLTGGLILTTQLGNIYYQGGANVWGFPAAFVAGTNISCFGHARTGGQITWMVQAGLTSTQFQYYVVSGNSISSASFDLYFGAIGRWF